MFSVYKFFGLMSDAELVGFWVVAALIAIGGIWSMRNAAAQK